MIETFLQEMLQRRTLPGKPVQLEMLRQIATQLEQANQRALVHGHLTPQSILVSEREAGETVSVYVKDFGAKFVFDPVSSSGAVPLAAYYLSPEQILGLDLSPQSDEFSFAVVAYEVISGSKPFAAPNVAGLIFKICTDAPPAIHDIDPSLTAGVSAVFNRALAKAREGRYAGSGEFMDALEGALVQCEGWRKSDEPNASATFAAAAAVTSRSQTESQTESVPSVIEAGPPPPFVPAAETIPAPAWNTAPSFEPGPTLAEYELPPVRHRARYGEEEAEEPSPASSPLKKFAIAGLILFVLAGAGVYFFKGSPKSDLPTQVLDTKNGPVSPPPVSDGEDEAAQSQPPPRTDTAMGQRPTAPSPEASSLPPAIQQRTAQTAAVTAPKPVSQPRTAATRTAPNREAADQTARPLGGTADVELLTEPPGASVVVDSNPLETCKAPCTLSLSTGRHTLAASLSGYTIAQRIFNVPETTSVFVTMPRLSGALVVTSNPGAATILVDGNDFGLTPATLHLSPGQHRITLLNGSERHDEVVTVVADGIQATGYTFPR